MENIMIVAIDDGADTNNTYTPTWTGTVTKESENSRVGISFGGEGTQSSPLIIASIRPDGLVAKHTNLCVGLQVLAINGIPVDGYSAEVLAQMVRTAGMGDLTIHAKGVVAACPPPQGRRVGMSLYKDTALGGDAIVVCRIWPESLVADSPIQEGMRLTSINGKLVPPSTRDTVQMILDSQESLQIVAIDGATAADLLSASGRSTILSASARTSATASRRSHDASTPSSELLSPPYRMIVRSEKSLKNGRRCGIGIQKDKETSVVFVKSIESTSIFEGTPLQRGHIIKKINGFPCPNNTRDAVKMIRKSDSTICLEIFARPDLMERMNPPTTVETNSAGDKTSTCTAGNTDENLEEDSTSPTTGTDEEETVVPDEPDHFVERLIGDHIVDELAV